MGKFIIAAGKTSFLPSPSLASGSTIVCRQDKHIIDHIKKTDIVFIEHIGNTDYSYSNRTLSLLRPVLLRGESRFRLKELGKSCG